MRLAALSALLVLACQPGEPVTGNGARDSISSRTAAGPDSVLSSDDKIPPEPKATVPTPDCPVIASDGWTARVQPAAEAGGKPELVATGRVTVPTGGHRIEWGDLRVAESYPVQIFADLLVVPPTEAATQVITAHEVRGRWPVDQPVGAFTVACGSRVLARVSPVETDR